MRRQIAEFHQDEAGDWVAVLACGHSRHMRHHPPWEDRPWVLTPEGRQSHLAREVDCTMCDAEGESQRIPR